MTIWTQLLIAVVAPLVAGLILPYLLRSIDQALDPRPDSNPEPNNFGFPWSRLVLYATPLVVAILFICDTITTLLMATSLPGYADANDAIRASLNANVWTIVLWGGPMLFLAGAWLGRRSSPEMPILKGALGMLTASAIGATVVTVLSRLVVDRVAVTLEDPLSVPPLPTSALLLTVMVLVPITCGFYSGRRSMNSAYLSYLLRRIPEGERTAIFTLAYEEATKDRTREGE